MTLLSNTRIDLDRAEAVARSLAAAVTTRRIYAQEHRRTVVAIDELLQLLQACVADSGGFSLGVAGGVLTHEGIPLGRKDSTLRQAAALLDEREAGGLAFKPGIALPAVNGLVEWLAERRPRPLERPLASIDVCQVGEEVDDGRGEQLGDLVPEFKLAHEIHDTANTVLERVMQDLREGRRADLREIVELTKWASEAACSEGATLVAPTQTKQHDNYTFNHSVNVFLISTTLLQPFARDRAELARFSQAALLHDVGKSMVPREVLYKSGRLTKEEFEQIKKHPIYGAEILEKHKHIDPLAIEVAFCHHMRDDGNGYPIVSLPIKPGPVSDIVQVADMFEALTAHRPYSKGYTTAQAIQKIIAMPGMASKQSAIAVMLDRFTSSPPGSQVKLVSGERALVLRTHPRDPDRPLVRVFEDCDGKLLKEPYEIDLRDTNPLERVITEVSLKPSAIRTAREAPIIQKD